MRTADSPQPPNPGSSDSEAAPVHEVDVRVVDLARMQPLIREQRFVALPAETAPTRAALRGCTVRNINSTAARGLAEMLQVLVGYILGAGVAVRWLVIAGTPTFSRSPSASTIGSTAWVVMEVYSARRRPWPMSRYRPPRPRGWWHR